MLGRFPFGIRHGDLLVPGEARIQIAICNLFDDIQSDCEMQLV